MPITARKLWTVDCDATTADGRPACINTTITVREGDESEWTGDGIWNRGQLDRHLRRTGWSVGKVVMCPSCAKGGER